MNDDITHGLDLLGDWLDAKGYTEEAGLCTRAMDEISKLRAEIEAMKKLYNATVIYHRKQEAELEILKANRDSGLDSPKEQINWEKNGG